VDWDQQLPDMSDSLNCLCHCGLNAFNCGFAILAHKLMYAPSHRVLFSLLLPGCLSSTPRTCQTSAVYWELPSSKSARSLFYSTFSFEPLLGAALICMNGLISYSCDIRLGRLHWQSISLLERGFQLRSSRSNYLTTTGFGTI